MTKYRVSSLFYFFLLLVFVNPVNAIICKDLFSHKNTLTFFAIHQQKFFKNSTGSSTVIMSRFEDRGFIIETVKSLQLQIPMISSTYSVLKPHLIKKYSQKVANTVKKHYPRRGWISKFIGKVAQNIATYFDKSDMIIITDPATNEHVATIRVVMAPYTLKNKDKDAHLIPFDPSLGFIHLPVEKNFLENQVDRPPMRVRDDLTDMGYKKTETPKEDFHIIFEISSLTVAKHPQRHLIISLLYKYLLFLSFQPSAAKSIEHIDMSQSISLFSQLANNALTQAIYAYGDKTGQIMYSPYSFQIDASWPTKDLMGAPWNVLSTGSKIFSSVKKKLKIDDVFAQEALGLFEELHPSAPRVIDGIKYYHPDYAGQERDMPGYFYQGMIHRWQRVFEVLGAEIVEK